MTEHLSQHHQTVLAGSLRTAWVVWSTFFAAPLMMASAAAVFAQHLQVLDETLVPDLGLRTLLLFVALFVIFLLQAFRRRMLTNMRLRHRQRGGSSEDLPALFARYVSLVLVLSAGAESIAVIGLILFLFGADSEMMYLFVGISLLALWAHRPRSEELQDLAR